VHARVLAVIRARPSREPQCESKRLRLLMLLRMHRAGTTATAAAAAAVVVRGCGCAGLLYAFVEASPERV
jgi:hypothetical protein